jgi:2-polyprenyl-3-methyl-5-hydroxy-6-metoxy-1,4-benzoquinol methylase
VVGIECDPVYAERARSRLDSVIETDLEELAVDTGATRSLGEFDCLIAGDVLEHLRDPWMVLEKFAALLQSGGTAVISLPNVRYWDVLWQVFVRGHWPRHEEGIFDRTHLRWFTPANGLELLGSAGLEPVRIDRIYRLRPQGRRVVRATWLLSRTPLRPFFTFQFVIVARKS